VAVATLAKWRYLGKGPPYSCALDRDPRYHQDDLDAYLWGGGLVGNSMEARHKRRARKVRPESDGGSLPKWTPK
jgi:hypothetical protein